ncbi:MAG: histidinol dehydrogenase [Pseudomonadota bacterium]
MAARLTTSDSDFDDRFAALLAGKREVSEDVSTIVAGIISDVRQRGDEAVLELTNRFDRTNYALENLRVGRDEIEAAYEAVDTATVDALRFAHERITKHHQRQRPSDDRYTDDLGVELGSRWTAIDAVGLYVPGGTAAYPSSVLMNAVPAQVAGVPRIAMVTPMPDGVANPQVLVAADIAGVTEIHRIGGAQAVAALAYGTVSIEPVAKVVGPGNAFVAAAKREVFGQIGIDMIAGPSEVLVIADASNDANWMAADLLAQAEHDTAAQSILITDSKRFADAVEEAVEGQLKVLPRTDVARASWTDFGAIIVVEDLIEDAPALANRIAAEHLELAVDEPDTLLERIRNAGAVFMGRHTPEAIGDYVGGSNHVLPTARSARFSSGLGVLDFMKRTSILRCGPDQLRALGPAAITLSNAEGLNAHGRSVSIRMNI